MDKGTVRVICGHGQGKTNCAVGEGMREAAQGRRVTMIQFLKGNETCVSEIWKRLEPEMRIFRFEKSAAFFETLTEEEKAEERINIRNGLNFAKKVMATGECDVLILDEILGILDQQIITDEELEAFLAAREEEMDLILTGQEFPSRWNSSVDHITKIENVEVDNHT
ncbi:MAG: cob(I)yrinic acid a,c-diamide adenosyltransferase [Lachnospiraceae bacterium]